MVGALLQVDDRLPDRFFHAIRTALSSFFYLWFPVTTWLAFVTTSTLVWVGLPRHAAAIVCNLFANLFCFYPEFWFPDQNKDPNTYFTMKWNDCEIRSVRAYSHLLSFLHASGLKLGRTTEITPLTLTYVLSYSLLKDNN